MKHKSRASIDRLVDHKANPVKHSTSHSNHSKTTEPAVNTNYNSLSTRKCGAIVLFQLMVLIGGSVLSWGQTPL